MKSDDMISTVVELRSSAEKDREPPAGLSDALRALWLCEAGRWEEAHEVAQQIETPLGSWIHALLHLIEGDAGNARYWYVRAERPPAGAGDIQQEWERIVETALKGCDPG